MAHNGSQCAAGAPTSPGEFHAFWSPIVSIFMPEILILKDNVIGALDVKNGPFSASGCGVGGAVVVVVKGRL